MDIRNTRLAKKYPAIADDLERLSLEGERRGASEGIQRLQYICEQYDQLTPNAAYLWLDPGAFQFEIEEAQLHKPLLELMRFARHIFSLLPLIATWTALFLAVTTYQQYLQEAGAAADKTSFLQLWQGGFHGMTGLTFTVAAGLDVLFLVCYLVALLFEHEMERRARARAVAFTYKLQHKVDEILTYVAADGIMHISDQSDIDRVVKAVKQVMDSAADAVKLIVDSATDSVKQTMNTTQDSIKQFVDDASKTTQQSLAALETAVKLSIDTSTQTIADSNTRIETIFTQQITPLLSDFHQDMKTLHTELGNYQGRLNDLTTASQQVATASQGLALASQALTDNADRYITIGEDIRGQIGELNTTQQEVIHQIQMVAGGISTAAVNMSSTTGDMNLAIKDIENLAGTLTQSVQKIVTRLDQSVQTTVDTMTEGVSSASANLLHLTPHLDNSAQALSQTTSHLQQDLLPALGSTVQALNQTTDALQQASVSLASIRLGTLLFGRRGRRTAGTPGTPPAWQQPPVTPGPAYPPQRPPASQAGYAPQAPTGDTGQPNLYRPASARQKGN